MVEFVVDQLLIEIFEIVEQIVVDEAVEVVEAAQRQVAVVAAAVASSVPAAFFSSSYLY